MRTRLVLLALAASMAFGQEFKLPASLDRLSSKAAETVDISLDGALLQTAGKFLSSKPEDQKVKAMITGLKGVYIRSYEFEKEGQYAREDLDAVRVQLKSPAWSRIVNVSSKHEISEIYLRTDGTHASGLVILSAEPRELSIIAIIGAIKLEDLSDLGGHFGIPKIDLDPKKLGRHDD